MNVMITGRPRSAASHTDAPFWSVRRKSGARRAPAAQVAAGVSLTGATVDAAGADDRCVKYRIAATAASATTRPERMRRRRPTRSGARLGRIADRVRPEGVLRPSLRDAETGDGTDGERDRADGECGGGAVRGGIAARGDGAGHERRRS